MKGILQADIEDRGIVIDPRTKIFFMLILCIFVIGGAGGYGAGWIQAGLGFVPFVLLLLSHRWGSFVTYSVLYIAVYLANMWTWDSAGGVVRIIVAISVMFVMRIMPSLVMGAYIMGTTTVSEFIAAMGRMHIPQQITVPLAVMFRFFPTVIEEFRSINMAMSMRDIRFGGKNAGRMVEYRLIPLIVCSVNIGNELSAAALTRGLGADTRRTNVCQVGFHLQDVVLFMIGVIPVIMLVLGKLEVFV